MIERFNRTIETLLRQKVNTNQKDWDEHLSYCCAAYRNSLHSTTEHTPNELMLGRNLPLPDHILQPVPEKWDQLKNYNQQLLGKLQNSYVQTRLHNLKNVKTYQEQYNKKSWQRKLTIGKWVWLNNYTKRVGISPKLQIQWEEEPYQIKEFISEVVIRIQKWNSNKSRIVHINKVKEVGDQEKWNKPNLHPVSAKKTKVAAYYTAVDGFPGRQT